MCRLMYELIKWHEVFSRPLMLFRWFGSLSPLFPPHLLRNIPYFRRLLLFLFLVSIYRGVVAFEVVADDEGGADAEGDEAGEEPGTEVEGDVGKEGRQEVADGVKADGEGQTNHSGDETGTQHATAATGARIGAIGIGIQARVDHRHAFDVLDVAQQDDEAKEDGERDKPADKDG